MAPLNVLTATFVGMPRWLFYFFLIYRAAPDEEEEDAVNTVDLLSLVRSEITVPSGLVFPIVNGVSLIFVTRYTIMSGLSAFIITWYAIFGLFAYS